MPIHEGFLGERFVLVPRPSVADALTRSVTRRLLVTDAGYFPNAAGHRMNRPKGTDATIVMLCAAGTGWAQIGGGLHRIGSQQAIVIPDGMPHSYGADAERPWTIWWAHVTGLDVAELIGALDVSSTRPVIPVRHLERSVASLDEIISSLERDQSPPRLIQASGAAWRLLAQLSVDRVLPLPDDPLQRAMDYMSDRLDSSVRVPDLARLVGVSPSHLTALFRRATGGGVHAHHTALRMARARQLLDTTHASIAEVASEVGYADAFYFSRAFRRHHRMSPSSFRARDS